MNNKDKIPSYPVLIDAVFKALKNLGGSGRNTEINDEVYKVLELGEKALDIPHKDSSQSEIDYRLGWARTLLHKEGFINNSSRAVWSIAHGCEGLKAIDAEGVFSRRGKPGARKNTNGTDTLAKMLANALVIPPWKTELRKTLLNMNPISFEHLAKRLLREMGFEKVEVTKRSNDGGIDGRGVLKIAGILSFNVAFQCKRYKGNVPVSDIRDFRGSLDANIEKGIFITTGSFTRPSIEEANSLSKSKQIDLMDGEELIDKLAELHVGLQPITSYEIDEAFFQNI